MLIEARSFVARFNLLRLVGIKDVSLCDRYAKNSVTKEQTRSSSPTFTGAEMKRDLLAK